MKQPKPLILGSTSIYRKQLLEKLQIPFQVMKPDCDEDALKIKLSRENISKDKWAELLSQAKAKSFDALGVIITSDQTVFFDGEILGKPKTFEKAFEHLKKMQNKTHQLITAVTIKSDQIFETHVQIDHMSMRALTDSEITGYLHLDQPFDAAGSYKIENGGMTLFEKIVCEDFTGIQGLPMIWVTKKLKELNYEFYSKK